MSEDKLIVKMLGDFSVMHGNKEISFGRFSTSKNVELFQMLMLYLKKGIPKSKLQQAIYDWDEINNKNRSLNNLMYRLKQQMMEEGVVQEEYILLREGICKWAAEIPVEVDTVLFEEEIEKAQGFANDEKLERLLHAFDLYQGDFVPKMPGKAWVMEERFRLKNIYRSCLIQIAEILDKKQEYERLFAIYAKAAKLYPFDEWQIGQIDCLQKLERFDEAYDLYQTTVQKYFDELGLPPSQKMLDKIQHMGVNLRNQERNPEEIREILEEAGSSRGAYYCTYPSFVDIYRYIYRTVERTGQSIYFMVCSIRYLDSSGRKSPQAGDILLESIANSLRKGDTFSRYSKHQFLILLTSTQNENCEMIFERIRKNFKRKNRNANCDLEYNVAEMIEFPDNPEPIKFKKHKSAWK